MAIPSLGYDVKDRKLMVNTAEAELVRLIFRRFLELGPYATRATQVRTRSEEACQDFFETVG